MSYATYGPPPPPRPPPLAPFDLALIPFASHLQSIPTLATVMLNLSKAGVTGNPSSRSRSPCRKNSSHALCDHSRDTLHGLHKHNNTARIIFDFTRSRSCCQFFVRILRNFLSLHYALTLPVPTCMDSICLRTSARSVARTAEIPFHSGRARRPRLPRPGTAATGKGTPPAEICPSLG